MGNQKKFPPYAFVPGFYPHPRSHPDGHSYNIEEVKVLPLTQSNWFEHVEYLHGIDLFNNGYYWEAHEEWEAVWNALNREGDFAELVKALIKLAAAGVKVRQNQPNGSKEHARRAKEIFSKLLHSDTSMVGFALDDLISFSDYIMLNSDIFKGDPSKIVEVVFDRALEPIR